MVGFPGLGIPEFRINGIVFTVGNFSIHWYGVIIALGFFLAALYVCKRAPAFNLTADDMIDMLIFAVPMAIIGARLYYVAFNWGDYKKDLLSILRVWDGGIAIYGAVIFSVITCALFCWVKHISIGAMLDLGALGLLIGQAIGRWGNFVNVEVYGTETKLPWRMSVYGTEVHPLFLYESLWNILGFVLLHFLSKKRKFNGQIILLYAAWYGLGRGVLEGMRNTDYSLMLGTLRVSQLFGFASCVIALAILLFQMVFRQHDPEDLSAWVTARESWIEANVKKQTAGGADELEQASDDNPENGETGPEEETAGETSGSGEEEAGETEPEEAGETEKE